MCQQPVSYVAACANSFLYRNMVAYTSTETIRLILLAGRRGEGGYGGGEEEIIYLSLHCHHQNDCRIKMDSGESHFNVSVGSDGQSQQDSVHKPQPF